MSLVFSLAPHLYTSFALFLKSMTFFSLIVVTYVPKCINKTFSVCTMLLTYICFLHFIEDTKA